MNVSRLPRASVVLPALAAAAMALLLTGCGGGTTVTVQGPNGGVASVGPSAAVSIGPSAAVSVSSSEGSVVIGTGQLPTGWPSEVGAPQGFTVVGSATTKVSGKDAYTATMAADGDQTAAVTAWVDNLVAQGFTKKAGIGGVTGQGSIVALQSAQWEVQAITALANGKTSVIVNVRPAAA